MKRFFIALLLFAGLFAVSCGSGYRVASSRYDDATYFRPDVTARVHLLASAEEAEVLKNETIAQARREGTRVETVYTDPEGVVDINVEPGTTYLIMSSQDDSYASKLERFSDEPSESFTLTINMDFGYDNWWTNPFFSYSWYRPWYRSRYWYMPYSYWDYWYWFPRSWYNDFWYYDWCYNYWYYPSYYYTWSMSGIWGIYPYGYGYGYGYYDHNYWYHNNQKKPRIEDSRRRESTAMTSSSAVRSGGSYRRTPSPQIEQISGKDQISEKRNDKQTRNELESGTRYYRRVTETSGTEAVYRDNSLETRSQSEQKNTNTENTFYRRSSNLSQRTPESTNTGSSTRTTNPGNSRSFYRNNQSPSATVNRTSPGNSSNVSRSSGSSASRTTDRYSSGSSSGTRSVSSTVSRSSSSGSSGSMSSSRSGSTGSSSSSRSSGGSYRR